MHTSVVYFESVPACIFRVCVLLYLCIWDTYDLVCFTHRTVNQPLNKENGKESLIDNYRDKEKNKDSTNDLWLCRSSLAKRKLNSWHCFKMWLTIKEWCCIAFAILAMFIGVCVCFYIYHYYSSARVICFVFAFESQDITQQLEFCIALNMYKTVDGAASTVFCVSKSNCTFQAI